MKLVAEPDDLWFSPPEMGEEEKAKVLRRALDEAWESDARGESLNFTLETLDGLLEEIGRRGEREFAEENTSAALT